METNESFLHLLVLFNVLTKKQKYAIIPIELLKCYVREPAD